VESWLGRTVEVEIGPIAHGGHCVARHEGRVVFVRHGIPGERAKVRITEDRGGSFCRGDAVEIIAASPDRVEAPCGYARPDGCGGCDFQHVAVAAQRSLKAVVVREQFARLAAIDVDPVVEPLSDSALGWRRRIRYAVSGDGSPGLHEHRSDRLVLVERCLIGASNVGDSQVLGQVWPGAEEIEVAVDDDGSTAVVAFRSMPGKRAGRAGRSRRQRPQKQSHQVSGPPSLHYSVADQSFTVSAGGFWQTHPRAAEVFAAEVASHLRDGDRVLDLYAGAGLFTVTAAAAVGPSGLVVALEGDRQASLDAGTNLASFEWGSVRHDRVTAQSVAGVGEELGQVSAVILDPPRTGAGAEIMRAITALDPRVIVYVACDPAALARDVGRASQDGWELGTLRVFDAFPMTHHMECLATLRRRG